MATEPQIQIKPIDRVVETITVSNNAPRPQRSVQSVVTKVAEKETTMSTAQLIHKAQREENLKMQIVQEEIKKTIVKLSKSTDCDTLQAAKYGESLFRQILQVINGDKSTEEFRAQWTFIVQAYKENKEDGFGAHRVFRGVREWNAGHDEYKLFQTLWSLIDVTNRYDYNKASIRNMVNLQTLGNNKLLNEAGRGRLLSFYI